MKKNSDKIILAVCVLVAIGLAYLGYSKSGDVEAEFAFSGKSGGKNDVTIEGADKLRQTLATVAIPILVEQGKINDRPVDIFVGVPLFAKKPVGDEKVAKPVDPVLDAPIHAPIPNIWWLENRINPGYADSPDRDEDLDGFTNREEFDAKSDPTDPKSFPALIHKLQFAKYESVGYFLWFSSAIGPQKYQFKIAELPPAFEAASIPQQEEYLGSTMPKFNRTKDFIGSGVNIFDEGLGKGRYLLKSVTEKEVTNPSTNLTFKNDFALIEDLAANKKEEFVIPKMPKSKERPGTVRYDRTAVLILNAAGEQGKEFKVKENTPFSLPSSKEDQAYLLKTVTSLSITVEYKDAAGQVQTIEIKKN